MGGAKSIEDGDVSGTAAGVIGASVATAGIIFASLLNMLDGDAKEHMRWICYGFSLVGIFIGVTGAAQGFAHNNWVSVMITGIGLTLSLISLYISIKGD